MKAGLRNDWDQPYIEDPVLMQPPSGPSNRSLSASSGRSFISNTSSKPSTDTRFTGDESDADAIGGISDNEGDPVERKGLAETTKAV